MMFEFPGFASLPLLLQKKGVLFFEAAFFLFLFFFNIFKNEKIHVPLLFPVPIGKLKAPKEVF